MRDLSMAAGWGLGLSWVLACTVAWGVGGTVGVALGRPGDIIVAGYVAVVLGGILAGVLQWLVLRPLVAGAHWWVLASIVAVALVGVVVFGVGLVNVDVGWVVGVALFGTVVGVLQWLVLRDQVARAGWWVLASTVGWVVAGPATALVGVDAAMGLSWGVLGAVYGSVTGPMLVWLLRQ